MTEKKRKRRSSRRRRDGREGRLVDENVIFIPFFTAMVLQYTGGGGGVARV